MGNLLSYHYWFKLPDFTDGIVHFKLPSISCEDEKERNDFYDEVCGSVKDTRENVEKTVRLIERRLFSCLHALSHISFDYKKLIEMLQKESLKDGEKIQDWSNRDATGCDKRQTDVELDYKSSEENREAEMKIENTVYQTEMEATRQESELLDEENRPSSPRLLNSENEMVLEWKTFLKTVSDNLEQMNQTANLTKNRFESKEHHIETKQYAGVGQEGSDEDGWSLINKDGETENKREEVAEEIMKQTAVEVDLNKKKELDKIDTANQKDNEPDKEERKIITEHVEAEKTEENKTPIVRQENDPIDMGVELTEESKIETEKPDKKGKTDPRVDNKEVKEKHKEENDLMMKEINERELEEERERDDFDKLLAAKIEEGKEEEDLKLQEKQREINTRIKTQEIDRNAILMAQEELEKASKDFQEHLEKRKKEFLEALKEKQKIHEEEMKRIRQARKEFEEETERIRLEDLREIRAMMSAFSECIRLKLEWEIKEDEWGSLLKWLRASVSRTKNQFFWFVDSMKPLKDFDAEDIRNEELSRLHCQTFSTYDTLYEAYFSIKNLSTEFPDRKFLVVLQKRVSDVCQCILSALLEIDNAKTNRNYLESLKEKFSKFDSSDIFYTSKLREMEKNFVEKAYQNIADPVKYELQSEVVIHEMPDSNESQPGNVEDAPDGPNHKIGDGKRQTPEDLDTKNTQLCY
ncbi:unnamed protein product [Caenorhabditis nigoni]